MVIYVAFIAVLNLALGYGLAVYLGAGKRVVVMSNDVRDESLYSDEYEDDEYETDGLYENAAEESEYQSTVS